MNTSRPAMRPLALYAITVLCLPLSGCDKALKLQAESQATKARYDALNAETASLDARLKEMYKALPPGPAPEEATRQLQARSSGELTILEANLKAAAANVKTLEAEVASLKKDIAAQRP